MTDDPNTELHARRYRMESAVLRRIAPNDNDGFLNPEIYRAAVAELGRRFAAGDFSAVEEAVRLLPFDRSRVFRVISAITAALAEGEILDLETAFPDLKGHDLLVVSQSVMAILDQVEKAEAATPPVGA